MSEVLVKTVSVAGMVYSQWLLHGRHTVIVCNHRARTVQNEGMSLIL